MPSSSCPSEPKSWPMPFLEPLEAVCSLWSVDPRASPVQSAKWMDTPRPGTEKPMELYKRFRGKEPKPDALLRRAGLI